MVHRASGISPLARLCAAVSTFAVVAVSILGSSTSNAAPVQPSAPAAGSPDIRLVTTGPGSMLINTTGTISLEATNPASSAVPGYNLSLRVVLPPSADYVPGSASPAGAGEPRQYVDPVTGETTLVWSDLADLQPAGRYAINFKVNADPTAYPVGDAFTILSGAYVNSDPRTLPKFDAQGVPIDSSFTGADTANPETVAISAIQIKKSEPSPEAELLRGVHDQTTVYTLTVTNNNYADTQFATVDDYLPAGLEFLLCGGVDNGPAGKVEYAGAKRLTVVPVVSANCPTPDLVETVADPAGMPSGIYTHVQWSIGTLAPNEVVTIKYRAGIPLFENTLDFGAPAPAPTSLEQAANLSNNLGASTGETAAEKSYTNKAIASGYYTGDIDEPQRLVKASDTETVTSEDLRLVKSVSPTAFNAGGIATYTLTAQTSEYRRATAVRLTDTMPDGLCPISTLTNTSIDNDPLCAPQGGHTPTGASYSTITPAVDGTTSVVFTALTEIPRNGTATVTFQAAMRSTYSGTGHAGEATVGGDGFTNNVSLTGTSRPLLGTTPPDPRPAVAVADTSWARQSVSTSVISKQISRPTAGTMDCTTASYFAPTPSPDTRPLYRVGDRICFKLRVAFPSGASTRDAVVTDVIPPATHYESGSWQLTPASTVTLAAVEFNTAAANAGTADPTWTLGYPLAGGHFVDQDAIFEVYLSVIVDDPSSATTPDVTGNLMKFRSVNTAGEAVSLRDQVDFKIAPAPPVVLTKTGNRTSAVEGSVVAYSVSVKNNGSAAMGTAVPLSDLEVWDRLPAGIACADVSAISGSGVCLAPGGALAVSSIQWTIAGPLAAGATASPLTYSITLPAGVAAGQSFTNTAGVRVYAVEGNTGSTTDFYPKSNIDPDVPADQQNAPRADDPHSVTITPVAVSKTGVTSVAEQNNNGANQATIGEQVDYTVRATVAANTSVYNGVLSDPVPTGMELVGAPTATMDGGALPVGATISTVSAKSGVTVRLTLPTVFAAGASAHVFEVRFTVRVTAVTTNVQGVNRRNTATLTSRTAAGAALPSRSSYYDVAIVEPRITIAKTNSEPRPIAPGDPITYTITVRNAAAASPGHDMWVLDELPAQIDFDQFVSRAPQGDAAPIINGRSIRWNLGTLAPGATATLTYRATLSAGAIAGAGYTNTAAVTAYSLSDLDTTPRCTDAAALPVRCYAASSESQISVIGLSIDKSVDPKVIGPGEWATYTISLVDRKQLTGYNATIIDQLPPGFDAATATLISTSCVEDNQGPCVLDIKDLSTKRQPDGSTLIGWTLGTLSEGPDDRRISLTYKVQAGTTLVAGDTRTNTAHLAWNESPGPRPTDPTDRFDHESEETTATVRIAEPQVSIAKSNDNAHPGAGELIGYTVSLRNNGEGNAYNVLVVDTLPSQVRYMPDSASRGGVYDKDTHSIRWLIAGPLRADDVVRLTYDGVLADSDRLHAGDSYVNTADLKGYDSSPDGGVRYPGGDDSSAVSPRFPATEIRKTAPERIARVGVPFEWRLNVTSTGAIKAERIDVADVLPRGWTYDPGSAVVRVAGGPARQIDPRVIPVDRGQRLVWVDAAGLNPGDALSIVFTATPTIEAPLINGVGPAPHMNSASATPEDGSGATGNGDGSYGGPEDQAAAYIDSADLRIRKTHTTDPVIAGQSVNFVISVANDGPDTAEGPITVDDSMPVGLTPARAVGDGWTCAIVTRDVHCERVNRDQNLAAGDSFPEITVTADVDPAVTETLTNSASVSGKTYDPDPSNNTDKDRVTPQASADLSIVKTAFGTFQRGSNSTYSLEVRNAGPSAAAAATVADAMPRGMAFVSGVGNGWDCTGAGRTATCVHADVLLPGERSTIVLTVRISNAIAQVVTNRSSITSPTPDPDPSNNTSNSTVDFLKPAQHYTPPKVIRPPVTVMPARTREGATVRVSGSCVDLTKHATRGDMRSCRVAGRDVYVVGTGWLVTVVVKAPPQDGYPAFWREYSYTL